MTNKNDYIGVTTGSVATACALTALQTITLSKNIYAVKIDTPTESLDILIDTCEKLSNNSAIAKSHKYPYNDPDVTVNMTIIATVELVDKTGEDIVSITGGRGVGKVTKPGLQIPVGEYAINPVPRKMIVNNLKDFVPEGKCAKVEIAIPEGEKIAKKTLNPKLGIVGGISILGTTGIARSMSSQAYKDSIVCQLDVAVASDFDDFVFVPGNIGEKLALKNLNISKDQIIQTGNYVGFMFEEAKKRGINNFTLFGHIGKLIKIAGGIFNTKHSVADGRKEIMMAHAGLNGANQETIQKLFKSKTTEEMIYILEEANLKYDVLNSLALAIKTRSKDRFDLDINVILVDMEGNYLNNNYSI